MYRFGQTIDEESPGFAYVPHGLLSAILSQTIIQ